MVNGPVGNEPHKSRLLSSDQVRRWPPAPKQGGSGVSEQYRDYNDDSAVTEAQPTAGHTLTPQEHTN